MEYKKFTFGWNLLLLLMAILLIIYAVHNYNYATEIKENNYAKDCLKKTNLKIVDKYKEYNAHGMRTYYYLNLENTEDALEISEKIYLQTKVDSIITENICLVGVKSKNF